MIASNLNELFGELRAMLSARHLDAHWGRALYRLLELAYAFDAERYLVEWVPYIAQHEALFRAPLETWFSVEDYRSAAQLTSFARFRLHLEEYSEPEELALWAKDGDLWNVPTSLKHLSQVQVLDLDMGGESNQRFNDSRRWSWPEFLMGQRLPAAQLDALEELHFSPTCELHGVLNNALMALAPDGLPKLERLYIWSSFSEQLDRGLIESLGQALIEQLRMLIIRAEVRVEAGELERLVRRADLTRLEALGLSYTQIGDDGVSALFTQESTLTGLRDLDLSGCELTAASLPVLAKAPMMRVLEDLDLLNNRAGDCAALLLEPALSDVEHLYLTRLAQKERDDEGPVPSSHFALVTTGRSFTLRVEALDGPALVSLLSAPARLPKLVTLSLSHIELTLDELNVLLSHPSLAGLEQLMITLPAAELKQHKAYVRRLAAHPAPWRALSLECGEALEAGAQLILEAHPAFARLDALGAHLTRLNTSRWRGLKRLASFGAMGVTFAQALVDDLHQLQWLWAYADGDPTRRLLSQSPRVQDALRASGCGAQCLYIC